MKHPLIVSLLASVCLPGIASAAWLRLPTVENEPVNLASSIFVGTKVQSSSGITNASALLAGSSAGVATVPTGASEAVISMGEQQLVDQVSFINDGVAGKLVVATSADQKQWTPIAQASFTATDREVPVKFAGAHAKYVRLAFDTGTGASIRNVRISGPAGVQSYKEVPVKENKAVEVNLASATFGSHPIYVYPTPANFGEMDAQQVFRFPKSTERYRTVVYDLGSVRTIKKFNAAYSRVATKVQVYAFEELPEKKDWRGKMTLDPAAFDELKPIATAEDAQGEGNVQIVPERAVEAQYVALRFEPNYDKPPVAGLNPDWKGMAMAAAVPFAGIVKDFGRADAGAMIAAAEGGGDDFVIYDAAAGGALPLVLISRASISLVTQQLGPAATEENAINTILTAAGYAAISNATVVTSKTQSQVADPSTASGGTDTTGLDALGLSAYRGSSAGGSGGRSPFGPSLGTSSLELGNLSTSGATNTATPSAGASIGTGTVTPTNTATPTTTGTTIPPTSP